MTAYLTEVQATRPNKPDTTFRLYEQANMLQLQQRPETNLLKDTQLNSALKTTQKELHAIIGVDQICKIVKRITIDRKRGILKFHTIYGTTYGGLRSLSIFQQSLNQFATQCATSWGHARTIRNDAQLHATTKVPLETLAKAVTRMWHMETFENDFDDTGLSEGEKQAVERIKKECYLNKKLKRFVTTLLLRKNPNLANNWYSALAQARQLHKKMRKDKTQKKIVEDRMQEFKDLDIVKKVATKTPQQDEAYYSPQRLVKNEASPTTPYRQTFNASSKTRSDESLNSEMLPTPAQYNKIAAIALQNRRRRYIIGFDIRKMYVQILVEEEQQKWLRFIWLDPNKEDPQPEVWACKNLIWGLATAAFISAHCIQELINMCLADPKSTDREKKNAIRLRQAIYVDDVTAPLDSEQDLIDFYHDTEKLLAKGSFPIGKAVSNSSAVLKAIPEKQRLPVTEENGELISKDSSILGYTMHWADDTISFPKHNTLGLEFTGQFKSVVSLPAKLYDPIGLIAPLTFTAKLTARECFRAKLAWDEDIVKRLPEKHRLQFEKWVEDLENLGDFSIPRYFINNLDSEYYFYCDASEVGLCSVCYCRTQIAPNVFDSNLVAARCSPAALKNEDKMTIPRQELQSTLQCLRLWEFISTTLNIAKDKCHFRNDNVSALWWLRGNPENQVCFVANRTRKIQTAKVVYEYVKTAENPADIGTRPAFVKDISSEMWLKGPAHLRMPIVPKSTLDFSSVDKQLGIKKQYTLTSCATSITVTCTDDATSFQSFSTIKCHQDETVAARWRIPTAEKYEHLETTIEKRAILLWIIDLWVQNTKEKQPEGFCAKRVETRCTAEKQLIIDENGKIEKGRNLVMTQEHRGKAERQLIKEMQLKYFENELASLLGARRNNHPAQISPRSPLYGLTPMLDEHDIIRVGGRLHEARIPYEAKHPIVVHHKSTLANRIIRKFHGRTHAPATVTLTLMRSQYWLLKAVRTTRQYINHCIGCQKAQRLPTKQTLGPFRKERFETTNDHNTLVIDYSGKYVIRQIPDKQGNSGFIDCYIVIYLQLNTRWIYLDVVTDMTTSTFLESFQSYCHQFGTPKTCMSDSALYFKAAADTLQEHHTLNQQLPEECREIQRKTTSQWHFNQPYTPFKGADWERNLKTVKQQLLKVIQPLHTVEKNSKNYWPMNHRSFKNILYHIAAVLNSRPLIAGDGTGLDLESWISPARLVLGIDILPAPVGLHECADSLSQDVRAMYKHRQQVVGEFWEGFMQNYIPNLQKANRWQQPNENIRLNQIVMIRPNRQTNLKRPFWKLARIVKITRDRKGLVRNVHAYIPIRYTRSGKRVENSVIAMAVQDVVPLELDAQTTHYKTTELEDGTSTTNQQNVAAITIAQRILDSDAQQAQTILGTHSTTTHV